MKFARIAICDVLQILHVISLNLFYCKTYKNNLNAIYYNFTLKNQHINHFKTVCVIISKL